jgi:hypothetical protein
MKPLFPIVRFYVTTGARAACDSDYQGNTVATDPVFFRVMEGMSVQISIDTGRVLHTAANRGAAVEFVESHGLAMMTVQPRRFTVARRIVNPAGYDNLSTPTIVSHWLCLQCGAQRGEMHAARVYNGSQRFAVDGWRNACGHVETYDQVLESATFVDPPSNFGRTSHSDEIREVQSHEILHTDAGVNGDGPDYG